MTPPPLEPIQLVLHPLEGYREGGEGWMLLKDIDKKRFFY